MKKLLTFALSLSIIASIGAMSLNAGAADAQADKNTVTYNENASYGRGWHNGSGMHRYYDDLTEEQRATYKAEDRKYLEDALKQDVKDGYLTQAEADQILKDFDENPNNYCGGYHSANHQGQAHNRGNGYGHHNGNRGGHCRRY